MTRLEELQKELEDLEYRVKSGGYQAVNEAGKPITPGQVRSEIRQYLLESGSTQSKFLSDIGVNSNSYGKFMNGTYKDPWAACQNGTYEAACIFFAIKKLKDQILDLESSDDKPTRKRAHDESGTNGGSSSSEPRQYVSQKKSRNVVDAELADILAVDVPSPCPVFANCDEVREMIREYLDTSGVTQSRWLKAIDVASNSLSRFLHMTGKGMGAGNSVYQIAWRFFEQKRILEGLPKSARRLEQEQRWGESGFPLKHDDGHRYVFAGENHDPRIYDIEWCRDAYNERQRQLAEAGMAVAPGAAAAPTDAAAAAAAAESREEASEVNSV